MGVISVGGTVEVCGQLELAASTFFFFEGTCRCSLDLINHESFILSHGVSKVDIRDDVSKVYSITNSGGVQ
jgi:hypothetical protein